jgi:predicted Zn finger-like uncharacterized protein
MSLITRCPACGTMFKVVTDQLKVSRGWVRCGRCAQVFDAALHFQASGAIEGGENASPAAQTGTVPESSSAWAPTAADPLVRQPRVVPRWIAESSSSTPATQASPQAMADRGDFDPAAWREAQQKHLQDDGPFGDPTPPPGISRPASLESTSTAPSHTDRRGFDAAARKQPASPGRSERLPRESAFAESFNSDVPELIESDRMLSEPSDDVSFVREARRKAFWTLPRVRASLAGLCVCLTGALTLQVALQRRNELAVIQPQLLPTLQTLCDYVGCEIRPPRHIDSVVIESSTFNKIGMDAYRLNFVVRNTGAIPVEVPAMELTLTDSQDEALIRRVVNPVQFGVNNRLLAARSEVNGALSIKVASDTALRAVGESGRGLSFPTPRPMAVAGYRVIVFYP